MNIYAILASKPHNIHYLNRYIRFIEGCQRKNVNLSPSEYIENHHICPKAKDMFPEYKDFTKNRWNKICVTARQHFIAHLILSKVYPTIVSQTASIMRMFYFNGEKIHSHTFEKLKKDFTLLKSEEMKTKVIVKDTNNNNFLLIKMI